jgi:hypothetical protein
LLYQSSFTTISYNEGSTGKKLPNNGILVNHSVVVYQRTTYYRSANVPPTSALFLARRELRELGYGHKELEADWKELKGAGWNGQAIDMGSEGIRRN